MTTRTQPPPPPVFGQQNRSINIFSERPYQLCMLAWSVIAIAAVTFLIVFIGVVVGPSGQANPDTISPANAHITKNGQTPLAANLEPPEQPIVTSTYREDFNDRMTIREGMLPDGWERIDDTLGVRWLDDLAFLKSSTNKTSCARTPELDFGERFEVEVEADIPKDEGTIYFVLKGVRGSPDLSFVVFGRPFNCYWHFSVLADDRKKEETHRDHRWRGPNRVRLVRDGVMYRVIFQDAVVIEDLLPNHENFDRIEVGLSGEARLHTIQLHPLGVEHKQAAVPSLNEDFSNIPEGAIPNGWSRAGLIGVRHIQGFAVVQPTAQEFHSIRTPVLEFAKNFKVEVDAKFDYAGVLYLVAEGRGNSPDVMARIERCPDWEVEFTRSDSVLVKKSDNEQDARVQLIREDGIYRVVVNGETAIAQPLGSHGDFRAVRIWLSGGGNADRGGGTSGVARLKRVSFGPYVQP